ncbi:MAG: hypothetical protein M3Q37_00305, partial [Gemmatimonadota bacterium]|nr:hypothetical protein [Gemmatimonadota bacterium]
MPPDDGTGEAVGLDVMALAADLERGEVVSPGLEEVFQGNPLCGCDFVIEPEGRARREEKGKGSNRNRWKDRIPGHHVFQDTQQLLLDQLYADLFTGFPDHSGEKARILR